MSTTEPGEARRKRLRYRAWHRGTREMDLVLGRFVDSELGSLSAAEVDALEHLMEVPDPELYLWIAGTAPVPINYDTPILHRIIAFHGKGPQ